MKGKLPELVPVTAPSAACMAVGEACGWLAFGHDISYKDAQVSLVRLDAKGNPILTQQGKADTLIPWQYITQGPNALYFPTAPEYPQVMQDAEKAMLPFAQIDPTSTLYSDTFASKGTSLSQLLYSGVGEVVLGRQPASSVDP